MDVRVATTALILTGFVSLVSGLVWGAVLDRSPYRPVVLAIMVIAALGTSLYAFARHPWIALLAGVIYGVGIGGVATVMKPIFAMIVPQSERAAIFGLEYGLHNAGVGLGLVVGGLIGAVESVTRYRLLYLGDGLTFVVAGVAIAILLPAFSKPSRLDPQEEQAPLAREPTHQVTLPVGQRAGNEGYLKILRNPILLFLLFLSLCFSTLSYGQFESGLPGYLVLNRAVGPPGLSLAFGINVGLVVVAQLALMPHLRNRRRTRLIVGTSLLWAVAWLLVLFAGRNTGVMAMALLAVGVAIFSVGEVMLTPILAALINDIANDENRGRYNALFTFTVSGGFILGPAIAGALLPLDSGLILMGVLVASSALIPAGVLRLERSLPASLNRDAVAQ
jgi:MFS family permease